MVRKTLVALGMLLLAHAAAAQVNWRWSALADSGRWFFSWDYAYAYPIYSLAISPDGNTVVVGGLGSGGARVFTSRGGKWLRQPDIPVGSDTTNRGDHPSSVAMSAEGTVITGCPFEGSAASDGAVGAAWAYTRSGDSWTQQGPKMVGSGATGESWAGLSVAISADGNTAIVGGPWDARGQGAAWVFTRTGGVWSQQGPKLQGTSSAAPQPVRGLSVAISADGNTAVLGGFGDGQGTSAAWVFTRSGGAWTQQGPPLSGSDAVSSSFVGSAVAISADGNTIVLGGPGDNSSVGAAWVFTQSAGVWSQQGPKLVGSNAEGPAGQGWSVAISSDGNTVVVGAIWDTWNVGAAWLFARSGRTWAQKGTKVVGGGTPASLFQGASVAISGDGKTFVVGGAGDGDAGTTWVFSPAFVSWVPTAAHADGLDQTRWRSDLGLLNPNSAAANAEIRFFGTAGVASNTIQVPAGAQSILTDVVGQLGAEGQGAIEIATDQPVKITARTYNQSEPDAGCFPNGTEGQDLRVLSAGDGLAAGQSGYLPGLVQNASYRTNIGLITTDDAGARVLVELFDGAGGKVGEYTVRLTQGQWAQEDRPFKKKAHATALDRGYAKVTVQSGSGVYALASVIDNVTNDPTTVAMQR
jgi:hypothetical protein